MVRFEDDTLDKSIQKTVENLIDTGNDIDGNIKVDYIPSDEVECYDNYEDFVEEVRNENPGADFYMVSEIVCGAWDQPLTMVAVAY